jgi:hypothetical protein
MKIFKIDAQGDTVYVQAESEADALKRLDAAGMGEIPRSMLTLTVVKALPKDEEFL